MNRSSNRSSSTERPCGLTSLLPLGMSCRGRAEAFARSLQSRLRTLGSQVSFAYTLQNTQNEPYNLFCVCSFFLIHLLQTGQTEQENGITHENTWITTLQCSQNQAATVTDHQPAVAGAGNGTNDVADAYFDFDMPGSPAEDSEYARLMDTTATGTATTTTTNTTVTPQDHASESGYVCASPMSSIENSVAANAGGTENSDNSSSDEPFFDPDPSDPEHQSPSLSIDYYDCDEARKDSSMQLLLDLNRTSDTVENDEPQSNHEHSHKNGTSDTSSSSDSLPKSQSTSLSTFTGNTSESNNTIGNDLDMPEFFVSTYTNDTDETDHDAIVDDTSISTPTNSIITSDLLHEIGEVREIPKYDSVAKMTLAVEPLTNGHTCNVTKNENGDTTYDDDYDEPIPRAERLRRSSSLKTGKTPPGTPGRKKIVRFADVLGLDLADVRTFMDEIPKVPNSAYDDLQSTLQVNDVPIISLGQRCDKVIVPLFQQPITLPNFLDVVRARNVALENAAVTDPICLTITGVVRVRNLDFHKSVHVRYTLDAWQSFSDLQAQYVDNSCDGFSDKYSFTLFGNSMEVGQRIEIALRFSCKGEQFWDNNQGINYCFQCLPATTAQNAAPTVTPNGQHDLHDSWCGSSFY